MPKLSQQQVEAAQNQGYEEKNEELKPLPTGQGEAYVYKLIACTAGPVKSDPTKQKIQWTWELTLDGRYHPDLVNAGYLEKLWTYTAVDGGKEWAIAKMLHTFGYTPDTDTDDLINDEATILVYPTVDTYGTPPKVNMKARRFATHYDADVPPAQGTEPPFGGDQDPYAAPTGEDPWATKAPEQSQEAAPPAAPAAPAAAPAAALVPAQATAPEPAPAAAPVAPPVPQVSDDDEF